MTSKEQEEKKLIKAEKEHERLVELSKFEREYNDKGYELEFKIGNTFAKNEDILDDKSIFVLQYLKDNEMQFIECLYENKVKQRRYLFNFSKKSGAYSYYFGMRRVDSGEVDKK